MASSVDRTKGTYVMLSGNHAVSNAVRLSRVQVVSAYPITPQTPIVEKISEFVSSGELKARFIPAESEHSVLAAVSGASSVGARTFTATSRQGLMYMEEVVHWIGRGMLPMVMAVVDALIGAPPDNWTEQDSSLYQRDTGWMIFYCETNQEVFDTIIQAFRITEKMSVPVMVCLDGSYLSHTSEPVLVPDIALVDKYLPGRKDAIVADPKKPHRLFGPAMSQEFNAKLRRRTHEALETAAEFRKTADREFESIFGRSYDDIECYKTEDAETIVVAMSTVAGTSRFVVDRLRESGQKVGLVKVRMFRPFPGNRLVEALKNAKKVAVIDRNLSYGHGGILCMELKASLYNEKKRPTVFGYVAGICGVPITPELIMQIIADTNAKETPEEELIWMGIGKSEKVKAV
ncbi:MAG: pyruvate ferredoxin oxidoreductase [Chloroflexi bacterium]|nr:pyruvate ferredoxin oxidoreductase [Chloroflexota bacterium]